MQERQEAREQGSVSAKLLAILAVPALVESLIDDSLMKLTILECNILLDIELQRWIVSETLLNVLVDGPLDEVLARLGVGSRSS